jgi:DNA-binding CsgD family transcriptional regulator
MGQAFGEEPSRAKHTPYKPGGSEPYVIKGNRLRDADGRDVLRFGGGGGGEELIEFYRTLPPKKRGQVGERTQSVHSRRGQAGGGQQTLFSETETLQDFERMMTERLRPSRDLEAKLEVEREREAARRAEAHWQEAFKVLTRRQREVTEMKSSRVPTKDIAALLDITESAVRTHWSEARRRMKAHPQVELPRQRRPLRQTGEVLSHR